MPGKMNVVVLFSGNGSNLEAIIKKIHGKKIEDTKINIVPITNNPGAGGIERAKKYGLKTIVVNHENFNGREEFDKALVAEIERFEPGLVVMAGFMRILTPYFTSRIEAINLHPSILPLFKGLNAIRKSFESGMKIGGVTVHRVTEELDSGEILAQKCVAIEECDTLESFTEKIHMVEHSILPSTIEGLLKKKLREKR